MEEKELAGNLDEVLAQMEREDNNDAVKLSPREYAIMRGIKPQLVYYYIRKHKLELEQCICGRNVIDVEKADIHFKKGSHAEAEDV